MRRRLLTSRLVAWGFAARALLVPSVSWGRDISFADARAAAARAAPDVQLAERRVDIANAEIGVAGALGNPTFTVSTARQTARLGTSVSVPLPLFGQRSTSIHAARADADVAVVDVDVVRREARWRATVAWVDLWEAQERARLLELAAKDADRLFQIANEKFDAGTGPRLDVIRTGADRARAASEASAARHAVAAASARLAFFVGARPDEELIASGAPGFSDDMQISMARLDEGLASHPMLHRDRAQVTAADLHVKNEKRLRWPTVAPQLTLNQFDPGLSGPDVIVGLSFDLPLLSLRGGAIARAEAQRAFAATTVSADEQRLRADLTDAYRRTEGAIVRLRALRNEVLPSMKEARDMTEEGYRSGRVDLIRLLEAQRAFLDSLLAESGATASWGRAVADLENAAGASFGDAHAR